ncbi:MAG: lipocalin-like domain-containing protein [Planctomycetota bacterium]
MRGWRTNGIATAAAFGALGLLAACAREPAPSRPAMDLRAALAGPAEGFARAVAPPELEFPRDHGPHPEYRTEWWYWTGNVAADDGHAFGFELVFFRQALAPPGTMPPRAADLAADQVVLAHAAVTDVTGGAFHHAERTARADGVRAWLGRGAADPAPDLACGDWTARASGKDLAAAPVQLRVTAADFAFALDLLTEKPPVLQGDRGLSQKSAAPGNASCYYSMTALAATGTVTAGGREHAVRGRAWCDREWGTSALGKDQVGWDWFSLQLDGGQELMWYQLRRSDGSVDPHSQGLWVREDATTMRLLHGDARAVPEGTWRAGDGRAEYPARWRLAVPNLQLELDVVPRLADQELRTLVRYWEGSVAVTGTRAGAPIAGLGYLEMTGYAR